MKRFPLGCALGLALLGELWPGRTAAQAQGTKPLDLPLYFVLNKSQTFVQSDNGSIKPLEESPFVWLASALGPAGILTGASVQTPDGTLETLELLATGDGSVVQRLVSFKFDSQAELDGRYPNGVYRAVLRYDLQGVVQGELDLGLPLTAAPYPTTPALVNLAEAQCIDVNQDFSFELVPFIGGTVLDQVALQIYPTEDETNTVFQFTTQPTNSGPLRIVLPKKTLSNDVPYIVRVAYDTFNGFNLTNRTLLNGQVVLAMTARSSYSKATRFMIRTANCPRLQLISNPSAGPFVFQFNAIPGRDYELQRAEELGTWQTAFRTNAAGDRIEIGIRRMEDARREFFRVLRLD